jgi:hypothetical protein
MSPDHINRIDSRHLTGVKSRPHRRRSRQLRMSIRVYLDAQAKHDDAGDQNDIFEVCRTIVGGQEPLNAIEIFHDSSSRLGQESIARVPQV